MAESIVTTNIEELVKQWIESERNGERFPVPFDAAWPIAGYSRKDAAKRALESFLEKDIDYSTKKWNIGRGKPSELISLSCSAFKEMCMVSKTSQGKAIRLYFIDAENKWQALKQQYPAIAQEIELQNLRNEGAKLELARNQSELALMQFRHTVTTMLPEPAQQKILGYTTIETKEYVDRTILPDGQRFDGVGVTYIQKRYGFKTSKAAWAWLESIGLGKDSDAWNKEYSAVETAKLPREAIGQLDQMWRDGWGDRQFWLGE